LIESYAWRNIEPVRSTRGCEVLAFQLDLAVYALYEIRMVSANAIIDWRGIAGPVIWEKNAGTITASFLPNDLATRLRINTAQHRFVGNFSRYP
jgi:hypothetical protein